MDARTQVKAVIPLWLKRRTFARLALDGVSFTHWLQEQMARWLEEVEQAETAREATSVARFETRR